MMALIQELQALLMKEPISDAAQRANKALFPYYETIQKQFGLAFADEPSNKDAQAWTATIEDAFIKGFRAGGQLMLEVLAKYSS